MLPFTISQNTQRWPPEVSPLPSAAQGDAARPPVPSASRTRRSWWWWWWWLPRRAAGGAHGRRWERSTPRRRSCTGAPELTGGDMGRGGGGARPCALEFVRGARRERERAWLLPRVCGLCVLSGSVGPCGPRGPHGYVTDRWVQEVFDRPPGPPGDLVGPTGVCLVLRRQRQRVRGGDTCYCH